MKNIAIIPARGGSKRIKDKNIKDFYGKPAITYAIDVALKSGLFQEIMVSTDSNQIAQISLECGAKIPFMRSKQNSSDFATTTDVLLEVIGQYQQKNLQFDNICCIYPCSMLIKPLHLQESFKLLQDKNTSNITPICKYSPPTKWQLEIKNSKLAFLDDSFQNTRSQDIKDSYYDAGQFYWLKTKDFLKEKSMWQKNTTPYFINPIYCQDIDDLDDWEMAKLKYLFLKNKNAK